MSKQQQRQFFNPTTAIGLKQNADLPQAPLPSLNEKLLNKSTPQIKDRPTQIVQNGSLSMTPHKNSAQMPKGVINQQADVHHQQPQNSAVRSISSGNPSLLHGNFQNGYHTANMSTTATSFGQKRSTIEFNTKKTRIGGGKIEDADSYTEDNYNQSSNLDRSHILQSNSKQTGRIKDFSASVRQTLMPQSEVAYPQTSGRSLSTAAAGRSMTAQLAKEGIVMLDSLRKKKETENQLQLLQNRIRRLHDEEVLLKTKENLQRRQIDHVLRVRQQAQHEKEVQQKRREELMNEMEERKAKIRNDKRVIDIGMINSQKRKKTEILNIAKGLRTESQMRAQIIQENKVKEIMHNQNFAKQASQQVGSSPFSQLEERRKKLMREQRHQYLLRLAQNQLEAEINTKKMQELQVLEQCLIQRLHEHTKKQEKVQEEYKSLLCVQPPQPLILGNIIRPGTSATVGSRPLHTLNNQQLAQSPQSQMAKRMRASPIVTTLQHQQRGPVKASALNNYLQNSNIDQHRQGLKTQQNVRQHVLNKTQSPVQRHNDSYEEHHIAEPSLHSNKSSVNNQTSRFAATSAVKNKASISPPKQSPCNEPMIRSPRSQKDQQSQRSKANDSHRYSNTGGSPDQRSNKNINRQLKEGQNSPPEIVKEHVYQKQNKKASQKMRVSDEYEEDDFENTQPVKQPAKPVKQSPQIKPQTLKSNQKRQNPVLMSGNSDYNAQSDEYQEINDNDLDQYEKKPLKKLQIKTEPIKPHKKEQTRIQSNLIPNGQPQTELQRLYMKQTLEDSDDDISEDEAIMQSDSPKLKSPSKSQHKNASSISDDIPEDPLPKNQSRQKPLESKQQTDEYEEDYDI